MRKPLTYLNLVFVATLSCKSPKPDIVIVLEPMRISESVTSDVYSAGSGFCSNSIYVNSDSTFSMEGGCEGRSHVTFGRWTKTGDSIEFKPFSKGNLQLVRNVKLSNQPAKTTVFFQIVDKTGVSTENFLIRPIKANEKYTLTSNSVIVFDSKGREVTIHQTDKEGKVKLSIEGIDSLEFSQLQLFTNSSLKFSTKGLPDSVNIILNINSQTVAYSNVAYHDINSSFYYKTGRDKLVNGNDVLKKSSH